jgi:hypothetical protein
MELNNIQIVFLCLPFSIELSVTSVTVVGDIVEYMMMMMISKLLLVSTGTTPTKRNTYIISTNVELERGRCNENKKM